MPTLDDQFKLLKRLVKRPIQYSLAFILISTAGIIVFFGTGAELFFVVLIIILVINVVPRFREHRKILHIEQTHYQHPKEALASINGLYSKYQRQYNEAQKRPEEGNVDYSKVRRIKAKMESLETIKAHIERQS